jgi:hypothetical protein
MKIRRRKSKKREQFQEITVDEPQKFCYNKNNHHPQKGRIP